MASHQTPTPSQPLRTNRRIERKRFALPLVFRGRGGVVVLSVRSGLLEHSVHERSPELFGEPVSGRQTFPPSDIPDALICLHAAPPSLHAAPPSASTLPPSSAEVSRGRLRPFLHTHPARTPVVGVRLMVQNERRCGRGRGRQ